MVSFTTSESPLSRLMLITTPQNACPSPVCFAPSFTAHSSAATAIAFDPAFSLLNTFSTRTYALFVTPFVLPTMNDDARDVRAEALSSTRVSPSSRKNGKYTQRAHRGGDELHVSSSRWFNRARPCVRKKLAS